MQVTYLTLMPHADITKPVMANGSYQKVNKMVVSPLNVTGAQLAACCGSHFFDLSVIKDKASMYYAYPKIDKTVPQLIAEEVKGVGMWVHNDGRVPESGEDDQSVFDTFTLENGEKITFQFRKCK
jgi:hypothetical protein